MKIGWLTDDFWYADIVKSLLFAKHQIFYVKDCVNLTNEITHNLNLIESESLATLLNEVEIVLTYFKNPIELYKVYTDKQKGLFELSSDINNKLMFVDLSFSSYNLIKKMVTNYPKAFYLEAPILNSYKTNANNFPIMIVSGLKYCYDSLKHLFADFNFPHFYVGTSGSSVVIANAFNMLLSANALGIFEGLRYAKDNDLDVNLLYEVVSNGAAKSGIFSNFFLNLANQYYEVANLNFDHTTSLINSVLKDHAFSNKPLLLTKIINGIIKKQKVNKQINFDLKTFADFYQLDLEVKKEEEKPIDINITKYDPNEFLTSETESSLITDAKPIKDEHIIKEIKAENEQEISEFVFDDLILDNQIIDVMPQPVELEEAKIEEPLVVDFVFDDVVSEASEIIPTQVIQEQEEIIDITPPPIEISEEFDLDLDTEIVNDSEIENIQEQMQTTKTKQIEDQKLYDLIKKAEAMELSAKQGLEIKPDYSTPDSLKQNQLKKEVADYFGYEPKEIKPKESNQEVINKEHLIEDLLSQNDLIEKIEDKLKKNNDIIEKLIAQNIAKQNNQQTEVNQQIPSELNNEIDNVNETDYFLEPQNELTNNVINYNQKVLIFDIDGTLLNSNHYVSEANINTLITASQLGHIIVLATGRCYQQTKDILSMLGNCVSYAILNNGALIFDVAKNYIIENSNPLSYKLKSYFLDVSFQLKTSFFIYCALDMYYYCFNANDKNVMSQYISDDAIDLSKCDLNKAKEIILANDFNVYEFTGYSNNMNENDWKNIFYEYKNEFNECNLSSASSGFTDIYPYAITKYMGYLKLKEILNFSDESAYYFGDSNNDIEILNNLNNAIAMGNSNVNVKNVAKFIIGDNNTNAISEFINQNILNA